MTIEDCTDPESGVIRATCTTCRAQYRARTTAIGGAQNGINSDTVQDEGLDIQDDELQGDGVETVEMDEFDEFFDDGPDLMNLDIPEEAALNAMEANLCTTFHSKLAGLSPKSCAVCHERDFGLVLRGDECSRCCADNKGPVKKFSAENNLIPGKHQSSSIFRKNSDLA